MRKTTPAISATTPSTEMSVNIVLIAKPPRLPRSPADTAHAPAEATNCSVDAARNSALAVVS